MTALSSLRSRAWRAAEFYKGRAPDEENDEGKSERNYFANNPSRVSVRRTGEHAAEHYDDDDACPVAGCARDQQSG